MKKNFNTKLIHHLIPNAGTIIVVALMLVSFSALAMPTENMVTGSTTPGVISYQGYLTQNGEPFTGTKRMEFRIYSTSDGASSLWEEIYEDDNNVIFQDGVFNVLLGSVNPISSDIWSHQTLYLGISPGREGNPEMSPRELISSVPYALFASQASLATRALGLSSNDGDPYNAVYVDENGKVGIGTIDPGASLEISGNSDDNWINFGLYNLDMWGIRFIGDDQQSLSFISLNPDAPFVEDVLTIGTNVFGGDQGQVGINTASPQYELDVNGDINWNGHLQGITVSASTYVCKSADDDPACGTTSKKVLTSVATSACFLVRVVVADADTNQEYSRCAIYPESNYWYVEASTDGNDNWASCSARCIEW